MQDPVSRTVNAVAAMAVYAARTLDDADTNFLLRVSRPTKIYPSAAKPIIAEIDDVIRQARQYAGVEIIDDYVAKLRSRREILAEISNEETPAEKRAELAGKYPFE